MLSPFRSRASPFRRPLDGHPEDEARGAYPPQQVPTKPPLAPPPQPPGTNMIIYSKPSAYSIQLPLAFTPPKRYFLQSTNSTKHDPDSLPGRLPARDVPDPRDPRLQPPQQPPPGAQAPAPQISIPPLPPGLSAEDQLKYQRIFGSTPQAAQALKEKFGLTGILEVVRMHDPHLNTLALGMDLTALGNMSFPDAFHYNAGTELPPSRREPDYTLPQSYYSSPPHMKQVHLEKYGPETLFYMFYNMPKESTQAIAAQELCAGNVQGRVSIDVYR
eukprot:g18092.t1